MRQLGHSCVQLTAPSCRLLSFPSRYVRESKAVFKIAGYWQAQQARIVDSAARNSGGGGAGTGGAAQLAAAGVEGSTGALHALVAFLQALTNDDADGRIVASSQPVQQAAGGGADADGPGAAGAGQQRGARQQQQRQPRQQQRAGASSSGGTEQQEQQQQGVLKFVLLNAAAHFARVVSAAHAVVLASGTLSPLESVLQLFPGTPPERVHRFACGHVVPRERLQALALVGAAALRAVARLVPLLSTTIP